jgi:hypothetical protein
MAADTVGSDGTVRLGDEPGRTARARASGRRAWLTGRPKMFSNFQTIYPKLIQMPGFKNRKRYLPYLQKS